ncbi:MAG: ATP-binding protein [Candidatus Zixiibacteriota bacterium]
MPSYTFAYPSTREANDRMLDDLRRKLGEDRVDPDLINGISLTVSEAFTNAVMHGNREDRTKKVTLLLQVNECEIIADIIDEGSGGLERINSRRPPAVYDEGGRGIDLIRYYADGCRFSETADGGLRVTVHFHRARKDEYTV